jgi:uncharacterized protein YqgV (UPF0045/DUF77 family)
MDTLRLVDAEISIEPIIWAAHDSAKSAGAKRTISTIRIDERLDKPNTLEEKVQSVKTKPP